MRIILFLCLSLCGGSLHCAAQSSWVSYNDPTGGFSFELPSGGQVYDSLHTRMYTVSVDSLLGLQVHLFNSAYFNSDNELLNDALAREGDTLRAIAALMLLATNSDLVELNDVHIGGRQGIDVGLDYRTLESNVPTLTFCRYFLYDGKFLVLTISGSKNNQTRLLNYKATFFNSIKF